MRPNLKPKSQMKKLFSLALVAVIATLVSCGPSAEEKAAMEKAKQDSVAAVQKAHDDSVTAANAAVEKAKQDSINAANMEKAKQDSIEVWRELHRAFARS